MKHTPNQVSTGYNVYTLCNVFTTKSLHVTYALEMILRSEAAKSDTVLE